ncbi:hypothetical protein HK098_006104 [Nowakowskiella sp. JEL0407]|nr:hypothetical protein HK098_006104 [Nowakowskiella sp. JEL0407]
MNIMPKTLAKFFKPPTAEDRLKLTYDDEICIIKTSSLMKQWENGHLSLKFVNFDNAE